MLNLKIDALYHGSAPGTLERGDRMQRSIYFMSLFGALVLSGCWNKDFNEPGRLEVEQRPTEVIFEADFDRTWDAIQSSFSRFPLDQKEHDQSSLRAYLVTDWILGKSDILYRGFGVNRVPYQIRYKLYVYVIGGRASPRTKVTIKSVEQYKDDVITAGVDLNGSVNTWIRTESSTLKEARLLQEIQNRLDRRASAR